MLKLDLINVSVDTTADCGSDGPNENKVGSLADIFVALSSNTPYPSYRLHGNPETEEPEGSFLIQNLVKRVRAHGNKLDLTQIMTATIRDVGVLDLEMRTKENGKTVTKIVKQNPLYYNHLTKFFFFPDIVKKSTGDDTKNESF